MKQIHGKKESASKPTTLDQIWGDTGSSTYGTLEESVYIDKIRNLRTNTIDVTNETFSRNFCQFLEE